MENINVIILEDEIEYSKVTIEFLKRYQQENDAYSFSIREYQSPLEFLETYKYDADLIFLDIKMPGISGMSVAKEIRKKDSDVMLIFITSLSQFAIEGYSVSAEDYIVKPLVYSEFKLKLKKSLSHINLDKGKSVLFINGTNIQKLSISSITYIETDFHHLIYHDNEGFTYRKILSMKECEDELNDPSFLRINSSYMVNLKYCKEIENSDMILVDNTRLKISRPRLKQVQQIFKKAMT